MSGIRRLIDNADGLSVPMLGKTIPKPVSKKSVQEKADDALVSMFPHYFEQKKADEPFVVQTAIAAESEEDRQKREADEAEKKRIRNKKKREARERKEAEEEAEAKKREQEEAEAKKQKRGNATRKKKEVQQVAQPSSGEESQQQQAPAKPDPYFGPRATVRVIPHPVKNNAAVAAPPQPSETAVKEKQAAAAAVSVFGPRRSGTMPPIVSEVKPNVKEGKVAAAAVSVFGPRRSGTMPPPSSAANAAAREKVKKEEEAATTAVSVFGPRRAGTMPSDAATAAPLLPEVKKEEEAVATAVSVFGPGRSGTVSHGGATAAPLLADSQGSSREAIEDAKIELSRRRPREAEFTLEEKRAAACMEREEEGNCGDLPVLPGGRLWKASTRPQDVTQQDPLVQALEQQRRVRRPDCATREAIQQRLKSL